MGSKWYRFSNHKLNVTSAALLALIWVAVAIPEAHASETITYYHLDAQGSPIAATDQQGNVIWTEHYQPYGQRIDQSPQSQTNTRWYTGHPQDEDTGLTYMGARYYDPAVGRFYAIDPKDFEETNLQSFNRYAYANNNPYKYIDPDGRQGVQFQPGGNLKCIAEGACYVMGGGGGGGGGSRGGLARNSSGGGGSEPSIPSTIYRSATPGNPNHVTTRDHLGEKSVSFRDSLSNPLPQDGPAVLKPGRNYIEVDTSKLPKGSVNMDGGTNGLPPGHVSVTATPKEIMDATVGGGKFSK